MKSVCHVGLRTFRLNSHSIADASYGFDMEPIFSQLFAKPSYVGVQRPGHRFAVIAPHVVHQAFTCQHIAAGTHKRLEKIKLLGGQEDGLIADETLPTFRIKPDSAEAERVVTIFLHAPEDRLHTENELPRAEWFRDVIVSPQLEPDDAIHLFSLRCEHDDGDSSKAFALAQRAA